MERKDIKVAILRMEGTNCEEESLNAFLRLKVNAEYVHLKEFESGRKSPMNYQCIFLPGGFSGGDYVRAGAIFASRMKASIFKELVRYVDEGYVIVGICNGFQVLVEIGLLPALYGIANEPEACLATNDSNRFECRQTLLKHEGNCELTKNIEKGKICLIPCAHAEGKLVFKSDEYAEEVNKKQVVFRYVNENGKENGYPFNPNGSYANIAGITNPQGNILGMMPHPERAFYRWQNINWNAGDGKSIFEGIIKYIERKC